MFQQIFQQFFNALSTHVSLETFLLKKLIHEGYSTDYKLCRLLNIDYIRTYDKYTALLYSG